MPLKKQVLVTDSEVKPEMHVLDLSGHSCRANIFMEIAILKSALSFSMLLQCVLVLKKAIICKQPLAESTELNFFK